MESKLITSFKNLVPYTIYSNGDIVNNRTGKKLTQSLTKKGGLKCSLYFTDGSKKNITVAHLMLSEFGDIPYESNKVIEYLDGDKNNLSIDNLVPIMFQPKVICEKPNKIAGALRYCKCCGYKAETIEQLDEFVSTSGKDGTEYGKRNLCKSCRQAQRNVENGGTFTNRLVVSEALQQKRSYLENREKRLAKVREYRSLNKGKANAWTKKYKTAKLQRTPKWLTEDDFWLMEQAYIVAQERTEKYGIKFHVDHIVPLQGKLVSGFHCPENLQVIPWYENIEKSNKFKLVA